MQEARDWKLTSEPARIFVGMLVIFVHSEIEVIQSVSALILDSKPIVGQLQWEARMLACNTRSRRTDRGAYPSSMLITASTTQSRH